MLRTRLSNHMEAFLVEKQRFIISIQQCELLLSNRLMWQSEVKRTGYNGTAMVSGTAVVLGQ